MRTLLVIFCLLIPLSARAESANQSAYDRIIESGTIKVGYFLWPPYMAQDPNTGKLSGISVDYMKIIGGLLDLKVEFVQMDAWGTQVEGLKQGKYDVVISDGPYTFTTIKFIDYSDPYMYAPVFAYVRDDDQRFKKLEELNRASVTFIGLDGDLSVDLVNRFYALAKLDTFPASTDPGMLMTNVRNGKADVTIIDPGSVNTFNANNKPGLRIVSPETPVAVYPVGFSVLKGDGKLLNMINGAVAATHNTYSVVPILKKWMPDKGAFYPVAKPYLTDK